MTIATLKKLTLCGLEADRDLVLDRLQMLGVMHLIPLSHADEETVIEGAVDVLEAKKALRYLCDTPTKRRPVRMHSGFDPDQVVQSALSVEQEIADLADRKLFLRKRIKDVEPWGDITFPDLEQLNGRRLWFYILPTNARTALEDLDHPWVIVHEEARALYVVLISATEPESDLMPVPRVHVGAKSLSDLRAEMEDLEARVEALEAERQALSRFIVLLGTQIAAVEDRADRMTAASQVRAEDGLLLVQGWVAEETVAPVRALADQLGLAVMIEDPGPGDTVPTLIEHDGVLGAGAALSKFYIVPPYGSVDPSAALIWSTVLFFSLIVADAGYGFLMALGLAVFWRSMGRTANARILRKVIALLAGGTTLMGLLVGSIFGQAPKPEGVFALFQVLDLRNFDQMMQLSLFIGAAHLSLANIMRARAAASWAAMIEPLAWTGMLAGGMILWRGWFDTAAHILMGVSAALIFLFAGRTTPTSPATALKRFGEGLQGLLKSMTAFGDVLSYMRLFALALAGASLASTFNGLAADIRSSTPGLGLFAALLILLIGHGLNLVLAVVSGVVHGLRLNFIEFFNWSQTGAGEPFKKYRKREVDPWTPS